MSDRKTTVILCFTYTDDKKYKFNSAYLRSDLRRIISFSHNRIGCMLENTYIITDIQPNRKIRDEIIDDFCTEVIKYLKEIKFPINDLSYCKGNPFKWVKSICGNDEMLYNKIINTILPVIRSSNVIEFASIFTNFTIINGKNHLDSTLKDIFLKPMTHLFFYYTGHGVRKWSVTNEKRGYDICLVVPVYKSLESQGMTEFYSQQDLRKRFESIYDKVESFIVFDCCHAQSILKFPYNLTLSKQNTNFVDDIQKFKGSHIYLSSTCNNQTCGFFTSGDRRHGGSLFTYYLLQFLNQHWNPNISDLREVEDDIQNYRILTQKKPQNISIGISKENITYLPSWLFSNTKNRIIEQDD